MIDKIIVMSVARQTKTTKCNGTVMSLACKRRRRRSNEPIIMQPALRAGKSERSFVFNCDWLRGIAGYIFKPIYHHLSSKNKNQR